MVHPRASTSAAIALLLLAFVAMASAEDAWVLYVRKDYDAGLASASRIVAQFKTRQECIDMMRFKRKEVGQVQPMARADEERGSSFSVGAEGRAGTALRCVHENTDIKARKGMP